MKDFSIRKKLRVAFGSLVCLIVFICGMSAFAVISGNARMKDMYDENLLAIDAVGEMREAFQNERAMTRSLVLYNSNSASYKKAVDQLAGSDAEISKAFEQYEATISSQDDRDLFNKIKSEYNDQYIPFRKELEQLGQQNIMQQSLDKLDSGAQLVEQLVNDMSALAAMNQKYAQESIMESRNAFFVEMVSGILLMVIALLLALTLIKYLDKKIGRKIIEVVDAAKELATGNLDIAVTADSKDELGQLADAFNAMIASIKKQETVAEALAAGDLTIAYKPQSEKDTMGKALEKTVDSLGNIFGEIKTAVSQVNSGADQVASAAQALSQGATEQASSIQQLAATINEIASEVNSNAENAITARSLADKARDEMSTSNVHMQEMTSAMNDISDSSAEISKIIKVIDDIAFQTNILALNAAVEAARAGAAGKGFAVVADEVRNLASKSAEAAKNTTLLIETSINKVGEGTKIAQSTAQSLGEVVASVEQVSTLVDSIADASTRQAHSLEQITQGVDQISAVVQTNSATSEQSAAASEELSGQANTLESMIAFLKLKDGREEPAAESASTGGDEYVAYDMPSAEFGDGKY